MEVNNYLAENFFIIDSKNLDVISSKMYGFAFFDKKLLINADVNSIPYDAYGAYVLVSKEGNKIHIQQDYNGTYGLFLYSCNGYFALSNSFLYLINFLQKENKEISLNDAFLNYFLINEFSSLSVSETLVKEVRLLPRNVAISISILDKKIHIVNTSLDNKKVKLDSPEGVEILDRWYYKWQELLINLLENNENIKVDLTGGFDSRAVLSIFNNNKVNFEKIFVHSSNDNLHTHKEDYEIASLISERLNFKLNNPINLEKYPLNKEISKEITMLTKIGLHKQFTFRSFFYPNKLFYFTGYAGEIIRNYWADKTPVEFLETRKSMDKFITINCADCIQRIIEKSMYDLSNIDKLNNNKDLMMSLYKNTRLRNHFGKNTIENFLTNVIALSPLMDRELQKIEANDDTLICTIYDRFLNEISDVKFDSNKKLSDFGMDMAKSINTHYPFKPISNFQKIEIIDQTLIFPAKSEKSRDLNKEIKDELIKHYFSSDFKKQVISLLGYEVYQRSLINYERKGYFPEQLIFSIIAIMLIFNSLPKKEQVLYMESRINKPEDSLLISSMFDFLNTARIDIKNTGNHGNNIVINSKLRDKIRERITTPSWYSKNGVGYIIESSNNYLDIDIKVVESGELSIGIKGLDVKDEKNSRFPVFIEFTSLIINGEEKLTIPVSVHHDKGKYIKIPVQNNEKLNIQAKWRTHGYSPDEFVSLIKKLLYILPFKKY